ncbi:MAG TPA: PE-PPE domain-containing protein [Mycobacterium sp.]|uniref:PE-PPE domain-containing protein n=1 Tax=Mycobacterium sp. TaxID=1785 RepID=UPI002B62DDBA|nr:PE-PPE domain-containing protein [Mycobacterium sp.]HME75150.1 PE-PPE domain-containing protein [Mycobacterium sp.]
MRKVGFALLASAGLMLHPAAAHADPTDGLVPSITYVMGATGLPDPESDLSYWDATIAYVPSGSTPVPFDTPEDLSPLVGDLTFDESVAEGVAALNAQIEPLLAAGIPVGVLGVSQSAVIASLEMADLEQSDPNAPASFVLLGDPMNPDGGLFERFPGLQFDGITFSGATPADDFPTTIYTHEYDPFADFCQYPVDVVCDVNAIAGITDHSYTAADLQTAVDLGTYGDTTYYMIPTPEAPLLQLISDVPVVGTPLADLLGPDLTDLINLGYGDPDQGWSTGAPDVATPAGLLPPATDLDMMPSLLLSGTEQGIQDCINALTASL